MITAGLPLDDFLSGNQDAGSGEWIEQLGWVASTAGLLLAAGLIVMVRFVHGGSPAEARLVLRVAAISGAVAVVGAATEVVGIAQSFDESWTQAFRGEFGAAAMMRLLAGLLLAMGLVGPDDSEAGPDAGGPRWSFAEGSAFGVAGAAVGVLSYGFDGHTTTKGARGLHAVADFVHVGAGAVWFGGVVGLVFLARSRRSAGADIAPELRAFSKLATVALLAVAVAGAAMTGLIVERPGDVFDTDWGRLLVAKTAVVAVAAALGAYQHFAVVPRLGEGVTSGRSRLALAVESGILAAVLIVTSFLVTASTL